ncbi:PIN-like domain-containing protein [Knoellia sp. 3-2P3]|uniref:PIN-like domain-containing protein n=1 Tax=unclassified Knoellia TaxID=2618719 RepID=UPI0023DB777B|nr:PIN-like domain-containing protein [Knoellia sp. 3-2P3]MDF2093616.1 PIN-like domain-containing protein [Knoellia sp. 3-2P3]
MPTEELKKVREVLGREVPIDSLTSLKQALSARSTLSSEEFDAAVIALDANVLLNIAKGRKAPEIIDYLGQRHAGPIILPSQVVQEFWNNQMSAVQGVADRVRQAFDSLSKVVREIDPAFAASLQSKAEVIVQEFVDEFGHVLDERTAGDVSALIDMLVNRAICAQVPRSDFRDLARQRKSTKTPPGFKDDGDGDFFVWADLLLGIAEARVSGSQFQHVILITEDVKKDWSTKGTTHPILVAEVQALVGAGFHTWNLNALERSVAERLGS